MFILCLTLGAFAAEYDSSNFSSDGCKLQPAPSGHVPGKDNGPGKGTHNAGEECGACHRPNGKASVVFTMSGTLYEDRAGRKPLKDGEIILQDINDNVISMTSNEVGNFWTFAPIASNPYAVASHSGITHPLYHTDEMGFHPADPNDTRSWQYKAWVKSADHVRPMITIAPVGGATDPNSRMSCSCTTPQWEAEEHCGAQERARSHPIRHHASALKSTYCLYSGTNAHPVTYQARPGRGS